MFYDLLLRFPFTEKREKYSQNIIVIVFNCSYRIVYGLWTVIKKKN